MTIIIITITITLPRPNLSYPLHNEYKLYHHFPFGLKSSVHNNITYIYSVLFSVWQLNACIFILLHYTRKAIHYDLKWKTDDSDISVRLIIYSKPEKIFKSLLCACQILLQPHHSWASATHCHNQHNIESEYEYIRPGDCKNINTLMVMASEIEITGGEQPKQAICLGCWHDACLDAFALHSNGF